MRARRSYWACVLAETNSNARLLQPSQSSLQPRTFPPRRNYCPWPCILFVRSFIEIRSFLAVTDCRVERASGECVQWQRVASRCAKASVSRGRQPLTVGQKLSGAAPRDVRRAGCTVAPRRGRAVKPAAETQGWPPPPPAGTPSSNGHEDTMRCISYRKYR